MFSASNFKNYFHSVLKCDFESSNMDEGKHTVKKSLVRNPKQTVCKEESLQPGGSSSKKVNTVSAYSSKTSLGKQTKTKTSQRTNFDIPEVNSTAKFSTKIDQIVDMRLTKSLPEMDNKTKLAVGEKVSRKMNFPYGQPVFKDLIPLTSNEVRIQPTTNTRGHIYQKDQEPVFTDFLETRQQKTYYHLTRNSKPSSEEKITTQFSNCLNLYNILQINEE